MAVVRAIDGDKGINNKVSYSITRGPQHLFDIDAGSGLVFTRAQLDREAPDNSDGTFILEITVKEVSKVAPAPSVSTEVTIILTDVNDETPVFRSERYVAEINENAPQNTPVNFLGNSIAEVYDHDLVGNLIAAKHVARPTEAHMVNRFFFRGAMELSIFTLKATTVSLMSHRPGVLMRRRL